MELLDQKFRANPSLKASFTNREAVLQRMINQRIAAGNTLKTGELVTIPVVFHVVLSRQSLVTDAQIRAQLDTINQDYAGLNGSASKIPSYFQSLFGKSGIKFALAQRTPNDEPATGIVRYSTTRSSFDYTTDYVKHVSTGGAESWDTDKYLNIWICDLSGSTLGYATFPDDGNKAEQGVAIDYGSLPGGSTTNYNYGKTLTHELGHFFNLYHIWGDDNGSCSGTDQIADTPNQGNSTSSLHTGVLTDNCTTTSPGIMYQNYMDYTPDAGLFMFTTLQVARMEAAFTTYRSILASSNGATPVNLKNRDAYTKAILSPSQRLCSANFTPQITLRNQGLETLTSVTINARVDDGTVTSYRWTGSLATYQEATVTLSALATQEGNHVLTIYTTLPNGAADEDVSNDAISEEFMFYQPVAPPVLESFENTFLPVGWDIVNEDAGSTTWEKTALGAKTGSASVRIANFNSLQTVGQKDYLRSPTVNIANTDSAFVSFQVAAASYTSTSTQNNVWDTLQVLISTDCGLTYTSLYKKWGSTLITRSGTTRTAFVPGPTEWRKEEINIGSFINSGNVLIAFLNIAGNENDLYLDDINIRTVTVNPNLKEEGFLVTPNPTDGAISVQFYPHPAGLKGIYIYNSSGQLVEQRLTTNGVVSTNVYDFTLNSASAGLYIVRAVFEDKVLTKKFVKIK
ncbi:T9SS type A sorting domain-containing protein [Dyadobacter psychrotolerans]|uniref:T9SS type A sorting domain-containing protein n=2 Tax=Dyadobacter psychrotolerans TaxID=2541721 RepID=A0A4R5DTH9_9BACT|nr:T9SS type A sorting domain-containing protein [Dyadobacter psychrotolerans]